MLEQTDSVTFIWQCIIWINYQNFPKYETTEQGHRFSSHWQSNTTIHGARDLDWESETESVVRLAVINPQFDESLARAINKLITAELRVDKFGFPYASGSIEPLIPPEKLQLMRTRHALRKMDSFGQRYRHRDEQARLICQLYQESVLGRLSLKLQLNLQMWGQRVRQRLNNKRVLHK